MAATASAPTKRKLVNFGHHLSAATMINCATAEDVFVSYHQDDHTISSVVAPAVIPFLLRANYGKVSLDKVVLNQWVLKRWDEIRYKLPKEK